VSLPRRTSHRLIVARGFKIVGWMLGVPSSLAALALGAGAFMTGSGPTPKSEYLSVTTYGLVGLLANAATGAGQVLSFLNGVAAWVFGLLAVAAIAAAMFAVALHLIGRGLHAASAWARLLGGGLIGLLTFNAAVAFLMLRGGARVLDAGLLVVFAYVLWVLVWRFRERGVGAPSA
jgi:hypothetical protein